MRRQMIRFALCAILAGSFAGALTACNSHHDSTVPLIPAVASPVADVPIPAGFEMTGDSTSKVQSTGLRFVDHIYKGSDDLLPVVHFYRDQMPAKGWTFIDQNQLLHNEISLHYTKSNEDCVVTVSPGTFATKIRVQIDPSGRNQAR